MKTKLVLFSVLLIAVLTTSTAIYADSSFRPLPPVPSDGWQALNLVTQRDGSQIYVPTPAQKVPWGVQIPFPDATAALPSYAAELTVDYHAELTASDSLTAIIIVFTSSPSTAFVGEPSGGCPSSSPSLCPGDIRLYFEATTPKVTGGSCGTNGQVNEYDYWWANNGVAASTSSPGGYYQLPTTGGSGGAVTLSVSLNPASWSNWCGQFGSYNSTTLAQFASAVGNVKTVGLSIGSGYFFSNGVGVDGSTGSAQLQTIYYSVS